jgi:thymidylate synthase
VYGVLGNLYSKDGINYLLRNILARPTTRALVLCGPDLTNSGAALVAFWNAGVDEANHIIGDGAALDREIPRDALDAVRANVRLLDLRGVNDLAKIRAAVEQIEIAHGAFAESKIFPRSVPAADEFPSEDAGFVFRGERIVEVWVNLLAAVFAFGRRDMTAYTVQQRELLDTVAVIRDENPHEPDLPDWVPLTRAQLDAYIPQLLTTDRPDNIAYTYGERLFDLRGKDQVAAMVDELRAMRFSRRAVAGLWDATRDANTSDPPCLNLVQARVRDEKLFLTAYFRSHDIYRAWLMNAFALRQLQAQIVERVGDCRLGDLIIVSQSAHIYADSWDAARAITRDHAKEYIKNPRLVRDPRGSFHIRVEGYQIHIEHFSPEGALLATFSGTQARGLQRDLAFYISRVDHAIYLGMELAKAELALKHNLPYVQDRELRLDGAIAAGREPSTGQLGL